MQTGQLLLTIIKLVFGTSFRKVGARLVFFGLLMLPSVGEAILESLAALGGIKLDLPDPPLILPLGLIIGGVLTMLLERFATNHEGERGAVEPNQHDVALFRRYRGLIRNATREFLLYHDFNGPFADHLYDDVDELADWQGASYEFVDPEVEDLFREVKRLALEFETALAYKTMPHDRLPHLQTALPAGYDPWRPDPQTTSNVALLNEGARSLISAMNNFERTARRLIPLE